MTRAPDEPPDIANHDQLESVGLEAEGSVQLIREFSRALVTRHDPDEMLYRLTEQVRVIIPGASCGIMLADRRGELAFAAASDDAVMGIERHQERIREGACYTAFVTNDLVMVPDVRSETRWPGYTARVLENGARAVVGVPMVAFGTTIGVLNVYRPDPGPWSPAHVNAAEALAAIAAAVLAHADQLHAQEELRQNLESAIASHDVIGQAKGILMARYGMDADDAFSLLRGMSQRSNRRLRDIAEHLVAQGDLVVDDDPG